MSIVAISHDAFCDGEAIATSVADRLGYPCVGPEIIERTCQSLKVPFADLYKTFHEPPGFFDRLVAKRERILAMFRAAFFESMCQGKVVYHGMAGHIFLADIPHVITVRLNTDSRQQIRAEMEQGDLQYEEAARKLRRQAQKDARLAKRITGRDPYDCRFYDLSLDLGTLSQEVVISIIVNAVRASTSSDEGAMRTMLKNLALAAKAEALLLAEFPEVQVVAQGGQVCVRVHGSLLQEELIIEKATRILAALKEVETIRVGVVPSIFVPF